MEIDFQNIQLIKPCLELRDSFLQAIREFRLHKVEDFSYPRVATMRAFKKYISDLESSENGWNLPEGAVPSTTFWLSDGTHFLGSCELRHFINESLKTFGGHISYSIRPQVWGKGLGTLQLNLVLEEARALGLDVVRLTCFDENGASARVMEKNGAIFIAKTTNYIKGKPRLTRIYEIELQKDGNYGTL